MMPPSTFCHQHTHTYIEALIKKDNSSKVDVTNIFVFHISYCYNKCVRSDIHLFQTILYNSQYISEMHHYFQSLNGFQRDPKLREWVI